MTNRSIANDFILLSNGNVIQGTATVIGTHVIIDRGDGNELKLAARQVMHSATTLKELYQYRQRQRQHPHVESLQDDARWCFRHQLYDEMKQALDAADELDTSHPETLRLRRQLKSVAVRNSGTVSTLVGSNPLQPPPAAEQAAINVGSHNAIHTQAKEATEEDLSKAGISYQAVAFFSSRIQPLLINRCGNSGCHRSPSENKWQLTHMGAHVRMPSRMTKLNLLATLSIVSRENGQESALLTYATTPHGGRLDSPLKRGDDAAVESLNEWINEVSTHSNLEDSVFLTELPDLQAQGTPIVAAKSSPNVLQDPPQSVRQVTYLEGEFAAKPTTQLGKPNTESTDNRNRPTRLPAVENPFDPEIFNRFYREGAIANNGAR